MAQTTSVSAARAVLAGALSQNKARTALSVVALALGVALGFAVQLINQAAINEFAQSVQTLSGEADLEVRGPRNGFDEALYPDFASNPEIGVASPVVEVDAKLADRADALKIVGIDVFRAASINPGLVAIGSDRLDVLRSDVLFVSPAAARLFGVKAGDAISFQIGLRDVSVTVGGILGSGGPLPFAVMDIAGVQANFERLGLLTRIDLKVAPGVDVDALRARLSPSLPAGIVVLRPETTLAAGAGLSRSYRVNLNVLALVALFTGGLLVFSTQALAVVRRRPQFALLRVLGVTRRRLAALIVAEGALTGAAGSVLGLVCGFALAQFAVRVAGADLGSGFFRGIAPTLPIDPAMIAVFFVLGVATSVLGSLLPAIEAARAAPAHALKAGDEARAYESIRSPWPGVIALAAGGSATLLPPVAELPLFGYGAIALILGGTLMLMPRFAAAILAVARPPRRAPQALALAQLRGAPGQAMVSLAAIVASVSLMVSMAIMVASFRHSLDDWLERILPADVYFRAGTRGDTAFLTPDDQARVAALPGVRRVEFLREAQLILDPSRPRVVLLARHVDVDDAARQLPLVGVPAPVAGGSPPPIWVSEAVADVYGFTPGRVVTLPLAGKEVAFTIAGVWRDYARQQGAIAIERERYVALTGDATVTNAALWLAPGTSAEQLRGAIRDTLPGGVKLESAVPDEIRALSLSVFDRTFAVTYALELAAVLIGLVGLSSSFAALVVARRREFGVLRHIGMTRRQIGGMLATEGFAVSAIGLGVGFLLGALISLILIHVVNRQSFHWGMDLSVPWLALSGFALALLALSTATALLSGRHAMGGDVVRAVKEDW